MAYIVLDPLQLIDSAGSGLALDCAGGGAALVANQRGFIGLAYDGTDVQYVRCTTGGVLEVAQSGTWTVTASGTVTANQGTQGTKSSQWWVQNTDGTNVMPTMDAVSRKAFMALTDGTNTAGVTPASTAATAAQPAVVVAPSPNSSAPMPADRQVSGSLGALNASLSISTQGAQTLIISIGGAWTGTILVETSFDGGATYPGSITAFYSNAFYPGPTGLTANGVYYVGVGGITNIKLVMSAYTSGTATIEMNAGAGSQYTKILSWITDGTNIAAVKAGSTAPVAADPALVTTQSPNSPGATSALQTTGNTSLASILAALFAGTVAGNPALEVQNAENTRSTYSVGVSNYGIVSGATDVFILNGSASKTIRITSIRFSMTTTTAVVVPVILIKRSAANTGGTTGIGAITPHDSNNAAATAGNLFYSANATALGAAVGSLIRASKYFSEVATPTSPAQVLEWTFGQNGEQPIVLRGTAQGLAINLGGTTMAGATMTVTVTWTEDSN